MGYLPIDYVQLQRSVSCSSTISPISQRATIGQQNGRAPFETILRDIKNLNILCFTESWLNDDMDNIQLAGFSVHRQDRIAASGKTSGGVLCLFVNNSCCTKSNIKENSEFPSNEVEYLMISCRPHYIPREFSSIFFVAVYLSP